MKIKVLKLGESAKEIDVPAGSTVGDAIKSAEYDGYGHTRSLNGQAVFDTAHVNDGDVLTLSPKIEGGTK